MASLAIGSIQRPVSTEPGLSTSRWRHAEILRGKAGPFLEAYMQIVQSASTSAQNWPVDPTSALKNSPNGGYYISCSDSGGIANELSARELMSRYSQYQTVSTFFGGISFRYAVLCLGADLPGQMRFTKALKTVETKNRILFVGNTADPTTPILNVRRMNEVFLGSALLTINGTGHLSYNAARDTSCASEWMASYFKDGKLPPNGTVCDGKQDAFASTG